MPDSAGLIYLGVLVIVFYLLIIRPQMQRTKQMRELMASLAVGDKVITIGGLHGSIVGMSETIVTLRVSDGVELEYEKTAIARRDVGEAAHVEDDKDAEGAPDPESPRPSK